ncbi:DUF2142 domain-containing protein [Microbacterium sp. Au-Mic1]|uniref:DUF2142 domain-containing protein n=1 Tax=Microbacterium sp. Au-Mic1 TaxID=2906457 RepID=UPI001E357253|nr:DUF2142 domain-containing protein [Microbacterium sp. Au-Mic1]MCE4025685.1 DUF2142 domain-containing protein [Microbacterium sp. Au-Mic1]
MNSARSVLWGIVSALAIFLSLGAWSLASPVGSSPDDNFHLASIWCGQGEREGLCEKGDKEPWRLVPHELSIGLCYVAQPRTTGKCTEEHLVVTDDMVPTKNVNSKGLYPPGYYWIYSFFVTPNVAVTTLAIRLTNAALFAILMVATWFALPRRLRPVLGWSSAVTVVPLGMFLIASINPSSWAITSLAVLFPSVLGFLHTTGKRRIVLGAMSAVAALMAFSSRGDAATYAAVSVLAALVLSFRPERSFLTRAILPAVIVIAAGVATVSAGQVGSALGGLSTTEPVGSLSMLVVQNLLNLPSLIAGAFGQTWGLGWLETMMPPVVWAFVIFVTAGTVFAALRWQGWRKALALAGVGATLIVVPMYILVSSGVLVGSQVQPRYLLPLLTVFVAVALAPSQDLAPSARVGQRLSAMQTIVGGVLLVTANAVALLFTMRRYVAPDYLYLDSHIDWWWAAGPSPMTTLVIGALSFCAALAVLVSSCIRISARMQEDDDQSRYAASASV